MSLQGLLTSAFGLIGGDVNLLLKRMEPIDLGGQFFIDQAGNVGEYNGLGVLGPIDNTNNQDLGNIGAANLSRVAGGWSRPFDWKLKSLSAWHQNNNANAAPWGWFLAYQEKTAGSNTVTTTWLLDEVFDRTGSGASMGEGVRDYDNNLSQKTTIDLSGVDIVIPADAVLVLGTGAADAANEADTNRYARVMSGYIDCERADVGSLPQAPPVTL